MSVLGFLDEELARLEHEHRRRARRTVAGPQGTRLVLDGREVVSFSSNDYLGLAAHPALVEGARAALERYGLGAGASRLIAGNFEAHDQLERDAAAWLGMPATRLFNSGFAANSGLLPILVGAEDEVFSDQWNHASLIDGCRLGRATVRVYRHNDVEHLEELLRASRARRRVIVTESVFSMDGDRAPLVELRALASRWEAILVVDEAHAVGVFGDRGEGLGAVEGVSPEIVIATFGKAIGSYGAVVGGSVSLAELLWNKARSLVFTTAMPPAIAHATCMALHVVQGDEGIARRRALWQRIDQLRLALRHVVEIEGVSPILPLVVGGDREVMDWTSLLLDLGLFVQGVRPPTVPEGTARLRITLSATHTESDVERLGEAIRVGLEKGLRFVSRGTGTR